jgi:hypothetical protein
MPEGSESEWFSLFREAQAREVFDVLNVLTRGKLESRALEIYKGENLGQEYENILNDDTIAEDKKKQRLTEIKNETLGSEFSIELLSNLDNYLKDYINSGIINPEIKNSVTKALTNVKEWLDVIVDEDILSTPIDWYNDTDLLQEELPIQIADRIIKSL